MLDAAQARDAGCPQAFGSNEMKSLIDNRLRAICARSTRPLRVELQRIDDRLARLGQEKVEVETLLSQPGAQADDFAEFGRRLAHVQAETAMLEERWLQLQTELEALQTTGA